VIFALSLTQCPKDQPAGGGNQKVVSFSKAKKIIYKLFSIHNRTFYCQCSYRKRRIQHDSCGYVVRKNPKRAARTEIEHVVPAHAFGQAFSEWRMGHPRCRKRTGKTFRGRKCARKVSKAFRLMEADLFNLQPAVGEVNGDRSNFSMGMVPGEARRYGACDIEIENRKVEPPPQIRGDVARTYLYMNWAYPGRGIIGRSRSKLFEAWDKGDPVDQWEYNRTRAIEKLQGNLNPFVGKVGSTGTRPAKPTK